MSLPRQRHFPRSRSLFNPNHYDYRIAFFFEAVFSSLVITFTIMFDDFIMHRLEKYNLKHWQKYMIHFMTFFVTILFLIYSLHFLFGYGEALVPYPPPK